MNQNEDSTEMEIAQGRRGPHSPRLHGRRDTETNSPSFRAHPYNRRPSLPHHDIDNSSRIHLPPPNPSSHSRDDEIPRQAPAPCHPISIPGIASLVHGSPPSWRKHEPEPDRFWHDRSSRQEMQEQPRPRLDRSVSGDSVHSTRPSLHPIHTLGVSEPNSNTPTPTSISAPMSMPPPSHRRPNPTSPRFLYSRPASPPRPSSSSSRSMFHQTQQHGNHHPAPAPERHFPTLDYRNRDPSPPLRAVRNTYDIPGRHHPRTPENYYSHMSGYGGAPSHRTHSHMQVDPYTGRPLGQPAHHGPMRHQDPDPRTVGSTGVVPGQSRRLAHLMSEQKRRESINTGFQALRKVVPSASPTDSKAVILRKAAAHIAHLETLLRTGDQRPGRLQAPSLEQDELVGSASDSGADLEDEDDPVSDGDRREPLVKAERHSPRKWE